MPIYFFTIYLRLSALLLLIMVILAVATQQSYAANNIKIAVMGDDYIGSFGHFDEEDTFSAQVVATSGNRVELIDFTRDGETSTSIISQIPAILKSNPDIVIVAVGMNDAINKVEPDIIYNSLDTLIRELQRNQMYVLLLGYHAPSTLDHNYILRFNQVYSQVAERHNVTFVGNIMSKIKGKQDFFQNDNIHPNKWGVYEIYKKIHPRLNAMIVKREKQALLNF